MTLEVDVYWSFRNPHSYLATPRLADMAARYDLQVNVRPVLPLLVRTPEFFERVNALWPRHLMRDTKRIAECLGLPFLWPNPDPAIRDEAGAFIHIHRLTRLGVVAAERGAGLRFIDSVSNTLWACNIDGWHLGEHLFNAAQRAGLDLVALDADEAAQSARLDDVIAANQQSLETAGHWGVPTMVFRDEPFFGQARLDDLLWRLQQCGLSARR